MQVNVSKICLTFPHSSCW